MKTIWEGVELGVCKMNRNGPKVNSREELIDGD